MSVDFSMNPAAYFAAGVSMSALSADSSGAGHHLRTALADAVDEVCYHRLTSAFSAYSAKWSAPIDSLTSAVRDAGEAVSNAAATAAATDEQSAADQSVAVQKADSTRTLVLKSINIP